MYCKKCDREWGKYACPIKSKKYHCRECGSEVIISLDLITCVDAVEMPLEVENYCIEKLDSSTHCQNDIVFVTNDNNVFAKWLKKNGYKFKSKYNSDDGDRIGIIAT